MLDIAIRYNSSRQDNALILYYTISMLAALPLFSFALFSVKSIRNDCETC